MTFSRRNCSPLAIAAAAVALALAAVTAPAQQITYYDFDAPQANPGQISRYCATGLGSALFCFNDGGNSVLPGFLSDTYPASIDPNPADNPPQITTHYAAQLNFAGSQQSSMWFSVPQKVANGFTAWFTIKMTPDPESGTTADGIAFVIQNAVGAGVDNAGGCTSSGSGLTALGSGGGCMGYGGIPNSLALEFDTYTNGWDANNNHIALQNCGAGLPNSPNHATCNVILNDQPAITTNPLTSASSVDAQMPVTLADGNVHQIVVVYSGPLEATPNLLQVFLDPDFVPGTHTPVNGSIPVFSGTYDLTQALNLLNSGGANDSAFVGFTSATGAFWQNNELMGWTFTPHTTVTQQQPLNPPGTPTSFDFGTHSYTTNFPPTSSTDNITMGVIASTITPLQFSSLLGNGPTQFAGSQCQVYDDTGGKCVIYSVYCRVTGTGAPTACPAPETPPTDCASAGATDCIDLTSSYNNSVQPISPGYLQGDPLYSPISTIVGDGTTATVTCMGECAVKQGQTITALDASNAPAFPGISVQNVLAPNSFTFASTFLGTQNGGFLTSNNVQNIFISYSPQNIDGSTTGKTKNFSDFVVTSTTTMAPVATIAPASIDFGTLYLGSIATRIVTITNSGAVAMSISDPLIALVKGGNSNEFVTLNLCPKTLAVGKSCYMAVAFLAGPFYNPQTAILTINDSAPGSPQTIPLTATVINPRVRLSAGSLSFGSQKVGKSTTRSLTVTNVGATDLSIGSISLAGANPLDFSAPDTCPSTLAAGNSCTLMVTFTPQAKKGRSAILVITDNAQNSPQSVTLTGTGN